MSYSDSETNIEKSLVDTLRVFFIDFQVSVPIDMKYTTGKTRVKSLLDPFVLSTAELHNRNTAAPSFRLQHCRTAALQHQIGGDWLGEKRNSKV